MTSVRESGAASSGRVRHAVEPWAVPEEAPLIRLVQRCLDADGGLPVASEPWFVRSRWLTEGSRVFVVRAVRDPASGGSASEDVGEVVAAVAVRDGGKGPMVVGLVDPEFRGRGIGARLLDVALDAVGSAEAEAEAGAESEAEGGDGAAAGAESEAEGGDGAAAGAESEAESGDGAASAVVTESGGEAVTGGGAAATVVVGDRAVPGDGGRLVTLESECLTAGAVELFERRGFRQVFAEDVMCADLTAGDAAAPVWVDGAEVVVWEPEVAERFHAVYAAAFRERPGFPDPSAAEWIEETAGEDDFRAGWSLLVSVPGIGDAGFVTAADGWIVQVGVVPEARRMGLGAALIRESLRRAAGAGFTESWLCVNVDNRAAALYRRLGFRERGRRARFQPLRG